MSEKTIALRADRFGKFYVREQKARAEGRNPQTGEKIRILAQKEKCVHDCIWLFQNVSYNILRPRVSVPTARWMVGDEWVYIKSGYT